MVTLPTMLIAALCSPPPGVPGDTCSDPIAIIEGAATYDTTNHTDSGYDLYSTCDLMGLLARDVWFQYDAAKEGIVTVSTCDPDSFDTSIIVYKAMGTGCDELEYLACNGDAAADGNCQPYHSVAEFPVEVGCTYLVRVGGWVESSWGTGTLALSLDDQALPDYCPTDVNEDDATDLLCVQLALMPYLIAAGGRIAANSNRHLVRAGGRLLGRVGTPDGFYPPRLRVSEYVADMRELSALCSPVVT